MMTESSFISLFLWHSSRSGCECISTVYRLTLLTMNIIFKVNIHIIDGVLGNNGTMIFSNVPDHRQFKFHNGYITFYNENRRLVNKGLNTGNTATRLMCVKHVLKNQIAHFDECRIVCFISKSQATGFEFLMNNTTSLRRALSSFPR